MIRGDTNDVWFFDIPEPIESWNDHRGESIYYKAEMRDAAGNLTESGIQEELIDDINDLSTIIITSAFDQWEKGTLTIVAEGSDPDGTITGVQFQYSFNRILWNSIDGLITASPYIVNWDTIKSIPGVKGTVWLKAIATDDDGQTAEYVTPNSVSIDNEPPVITNDYDGIWHNKDFSINLKASDMTGVGVATISYKLNNGLTQEKPITQQLSGQVAIVVDMTTEGIANTIEYWSTDLIGNESEHQTQSNIKLDKRLRHLPNGNKNQRT